MRTILAAATTAVAVICGLIAAGPVAAAEPVWLCKPGQGNDPCSPGLSTTRVSPDGKRLGTERPRPDRRPAVDCFYVYPTVSDDRGPVADLSVDPELRSIALYQAARYSQHCRVYAPVYRQITLSGLVEPQTIPPNARTVAYSDVRNAWRTYLRKHNKGRGVILIGHSQGTFMLRELVAREIDRKPAVRRRLVAAYLMGGNVLVRRGGDSGGDFRNIRACRSARQTGCVVAFATYGGRPPEDARFGRTDVRGREALCVNPANLRRGGAGRLDSILPSEPFAPETTMGGLTAAVGYPRPSVSTTWVAAPGAYRGRCVSSGGTNVLQATPLGGAPRLASLPDASWGWHLADANLPLGNLVRLARSQIDAHLARRGGRPVAFAG